MHGYEGSKDDLLKRLRRAEGQVRGIGRMVEEDKYCIDILTQVSAATKALETVALSLLSDHLSHCVAEATAEGGPVAQEKIREANEAIARLVRSREGEDHARSAPGPGPHRSRRRHRGRLVNVGGTGRGQGRGGAVRDA